MLSKDYELFFLLQPSFCCWRLGRIDAEGVMNVNMNVMTSTLTFSAVITRYLRLGTLTLNDFTVMM